MEFLHTQNSSGQVSKTKTARCSSQVRGLSLRDENLFVSAKRVTLGDNAHI